MNRFGKITVVGGGYVGLSLACMLEAQAEVTLLDVDRAKVDRINEHISPLADEGLREWFAGNASPRLTATMSREEAYGNAELVIVAAPTDLDPQSNEFDTSIVESVIRDALRFHSSPDEGGPLIVIRSTVPIGFTKRMRGETGSDRIMFSPEFLREGHALDDSLAPSRIIIGAEKDRPDSMRDAEAFLETVLQCCTDRSCPVRIIDSSEAEAVKLFSNSYLAMRIAFFNELDSFAESRGLNTHDIIEGMGMDSRIGPYYNNPSFGYGGYCLPKDTRQLFSQYAGIPQELIAAIVESNRTRIDFIAGRILNKLEQLREQGDAADDLRLGIYRLNMKKGSDNCRQSATLQLLEKLAGRGVAVDVYEPLLEEPSLEGFKDCRKLDDLDRFKRDCDMILANRMEPCLEEIREKVYTRDVFFMD